MRPAEFEWKLGKLDSIRAIDCDNELQSVQKLTGNEIEQKFGIE